MESEPLVLRSTAIPEWDERDLDQGELGPEAQPADDQQTAEMLGSVALRLPVVLAEQSLAEARARETPLRVRLRQSDSFAYQLLAVPLTIIVPDGLRLARLRMSLAFTDHGDEGSVVAHDLAPTTKTVEESHDYGRISLDISKALTFVFPPAAECLGLQLAFPLRWTSTFPVVQASGFNSNPVEWLVEDAAVREGFIGYVITRSAPASPFTVTARIAAELRQAFLGRIRRARFVSDQRDYRIDGEAGVEP